MSRLSLETQQLIRYLQECHQNNCMATYDGMSKVIHADIKSRRGYLSSAIAVCLRDYGLNFEVAPNKGYLPVPREKVGETATTDAQRKIRCATRKWRDRLDSVDVGTLSGSTLQQHITGYAKLELQERLTSPDVNRAIEAKVAQKHMTGRAGLEYARQAALALIDVS